jgi:hypothetical protein
MKSLQRTRSIEDERSVIVQLTEKEVNWKHPSWKLIKILLTENIDVSDVIKLKEMLNDWITLLTDNKTNKRIKQKTNNMELLDKLNWDTAKAMNGTKVPQEKLTTSLKRSHLLQLQVVYNLLRSL